jgi:hypothetical protein
MAKYRPIQNAKTALQLSVRNSRSMRVSHRPGSPASSRTAAWSSGPPPHNIAIDRKLMITAIGQPRMTDAPRTRGMRAAMGSVCQRCRLMYRRSR